MIFLSDLTGFPRALSMVIRPGSKALRDRKMTSWDPLELALKPGLFLAIFKVQRNDLSYSDETEPTHNDPDHKLA
ncbi:unnamed protein product [Dovyalis caffra]|uniref:Uncharacterized protein n=1 Tax=Dovyalis caffra TaxID=77055 RepID=A0AAV1SK14_9ROSI|nr:unnamed protein product [Dovyalis caffra]